MAIEQGTSKQTRIKRQTGLGVLAVTTLGQVLRRKSSTFELAKETATTEDEMTSTQQVKSLRHGTRLVNGSIDGLLSPGTYADPLSAIMRRDFAAVVAMTALGVTIAGAGPIYTLTRAAGSFLTSNVKIGMVARLTLAMNAANLNKNLLILSVTALSLTVYSLDGSALVAEGPIAGVTMTIPGKVNHVPDAGHTNIFHTVEEWFPGIPYSERNTDFKFTKADISLPGTGNATIKLTGNGLNQLDAGVTYFTTLTPETSTDVVNASGGFLMIGGVAQAIVTDMSFSVDGKGAPADGVVGTNLRPDVFTGKVIVTGSFTAYFDSATLASAFKTETPVAIVGALMAAQSPLADFITYAMTNVKLTSNSPDDNPTGLKRTYSFQSIYDAAGGAALAMQPTSLQIHDSAAA